MSDKVAVFIFSFRKLVLQMELQGWLMLCGVGLAGVAAVLLLMGLFSASGTSYEEAIAQQRKATTELLSLAESKNKAKKTNKKEKKEKKVCFSEICDNCCFYFNSLKWLVDELFLVNHSFYLIV